MKYWKLTLVDKGTFYWIDKDKGTLTLIASREKQFATEAEAQKAARAHPNFAAQIKLFDPVEHELKVRELRLLAAQQEQDEQ